MIPRILSYTSELSEPKTTDKKDDTHLNTFTQNIKNNFTF